MCYLSKILLIITICLTTSYSQGWAQETQLKKLIQTINKKLKSASPYKGYIEISDEGELIHHQKVNPGLRKIKLNDIDTIKYFYDRFDPNKAPFSVELTCKDGECAQVEWIDGMKMNYFSLIFSFNNKDDAEKMITTLQDLIDLALKPRL